MRKSGYMDFFFFVSSEKPGKFLLWVKKVFFSSPNCFIYALTRSGDLKESFEYLSVVLAQLEQEMWSKCNAWSYFIQKHEKKHKSLGRDLKEIFLLYKMYVSSGSDGMRNLLRCGRLEKLISNSPPKKRPLKMTPCDVTIT